MDNKKVTIEITKEACAALRSFLMNDRGGTGEGYSDFILMSIDVRRQIAALTAENTRLREAQFKAVKTLKRMVKTWHNYASGHYCQTYNPGMAQGLNGAADMLEEYVNEAWRALGE